MVDSFKKLKIKYKLPDIQDIEELFEVTIKSDNLVMQNIRNEIGFKAYETMKSLESLLFINEGTDPETLFTELMIRDIKKEAHELYKELNKLHTKASRIKYEHSRKKDADFIMSAFKKWPKLEKSLKLIFEKIEEGWESIELSPKNLPESYHE